MRDKIYAIDEIFDIIKQDRKAGVRLLYEKHYNKLYGIAFSIVGNKFVAEDVVEEVVLKLLSIGDDKLPEKNCVAWLYVLIRNQAIQVLRKEKKTLPVDYISDLPDKNNRIAEYVDLSAFYDMIKDLPVGQRKIVSLKVLGGYTHKEIARMLGRPVGTVQWLYNAAIKHLRVLKILLVIVMMGAGAALSFLLFIAGLATDKADSSVSYNSSTSHIMPRGSSGLGLALYISAAVCAVIIVVAVVILVIVTTKGKKPNKNGKSKRH